MRKTFERARLLSRRMGRAVAIALVLLVAVSAGVVVLALVDPLWLSAQMTRAYAPPSAFAASPLHAGLFALVFAAQAGLAGRALWALGRAFDAIAENDALTAAAGLWTRRAGLAFLASGIAMVLAHPLNSAIMSIGAPPGGRFVSVAFSTGELLALVVSGVLLVFGHVIAVAAAIDEENRGFV